MITHIDLFIGGTNMKFLKSTQSKVLAAVAAVMALSASAAYSTDCYSYCNTQASLAAQNAKQQALTYLPQCYVVPPSGVASCVQSVTANADVVYGTVYGQTMTQCMNGCHQ
jgi:hypothetical protein